MKRVTSTTALAFLAFLLAAPAGAQQQPGLRLPPFQKTALPNGTRVLLLEQHEVPLVSFAIVVKSGSAQDPPGKEGLASMTNDLLRKGTRTRTADQVSSELDFLGGTLSTDESPDFLRVRAEFMKKDAATGLALLADILTNPVFPQAEIEKLAKQRVDGIRSAKDRATFVIGTYFSAFLYGKHPYGRPPEGDEKSVPSLTRADIVKFHEQHYVGGNMIIAAAGDFDAADMQKLVADQFGALPTRTPPAASLPAPAPGKGRRLLLIDKPDSTQTFYRIGNVGISRTNPDRVAIQVVNTLFGGRFTSLLNSQLRISSGLTYGANSFFETLKQPGPFEMASYTRNETTEKAMDMTLVILKQFHEAGPTEEQLRSAQAYVKGQFPPRIETSDQLAALLAELELYGLDEREINEFFPRVDAVTLADARRVIRQYFPEDDLAFVVIGKASQIGALMKKYAAAIETRSITEPGFWEARP